MSLNNWHSEIQLESYHSIFSAPQKTCNFRFKADLFFLTCGLLQNKREETFNLIVKKMNWRFDIHVYYIASKGNLTMSKTSILLQTLECKSILINVQDSIFIHFFK